MKITQMERLRREADGGRGITKAELARRAKMQGSVIGWIEEGRFKPYDSQLAKLAEALGADEPGKLLELVEA